MTSRLPLKLYTEPDLLEPPIKKRAMILAYLGSQIIKQ